MPGLDPLLSTLILFLVSAGFIAYFGTRLTKTADEFADISGLGEAITGAVFLGAMTSLPGIITSVTAASKGYPNLAISNAVGGIAAQTVFLAIADFFHRRSNLEHAAASLSNLASGCILMGLMALVLMAQFSPYLVLFGIHFFSPLIILFYLFGLRLISRIAAEPMWGPIQTFETELDEAASSTQSTAKILKKLLLLLALGGVVGFAGYLVALSGVQLVGRTGMSEGVIGTLFYRYRHFTSRVSNNCCCRST